jgi:predicted transcriptional regulator
VTSNGLLIGIILREGLYSVLANGKDNHLNANEENDFCFPESQTSGVITVDIGLHVINGCQLVSEACTVARAYHMFTTMGLRHAPVVGIDGQVLGMLTRKDFLPS